MKSLLCESFFRLAKSIECWLGVFLTALFTIITSAAYLGNDTAYVDEWAFGGVTFAAIFGSAVLGMYFFHDHTEGTLRLKISSGNPRMILYIANLVISVCYMLMLGIVYAVSAYIMSMTDISTKGFESGAAMKSALLLLGILTANSAVTVLIGMAAKGVFSAVLPVLVNIIMMFVMGFISGGSDKGTFGRLLSEMLPYSQTDHLSCINVPSHLPLMLLYSVIVTAAASAAGIAIFRRSDLK